jgi:hypothetical protein
MRRTLIAIATATAAIADACDWAEGTENPITKNVAFANKVLAVLVAILLISAVASIRARNRYWIPITIGLASLNSWLDIRHAYGGDCGSTAVRTSLFSASLAFAALCAQLIVNRRPGVQELPN